MKKSFPKILIITFLAIFIVQLFGLVLLFTLPQPSQAADIKFPQVGIPGSEFDTGKTYDFSKDASTKPIALYIQAIYKYAIGIVGILAAIVLMFGGVLWIVAGGNASQISEAKAWIGAALTGLILALTSYLILYTVNQALVNLQTSAVPGVSNLSGSCMVDGLCYNNWTKDDCESPKYKGSYSTSPCTASKSSSYCVDGLIESKTDCLSSFADVDGAKFESYMAAGVCKYQVSMAGGTSNSKGPCVTANTSSGASSGTIGACCSFTK